MKEAKAVISLLQKYDFARPTSDDHKKAAYDSKKRIYKNIVKHEHGLPLFFSLVFKMYEFLRKRGMEISISGANRFVNTAVSFAAILVLAGGAFTYYTNFYNNTVGPVAVDDGSKYNTPLTGVVSMIIGDVQIADAAGVFKKASTGDVISEGMKIVTKGNKSRADIYFGENAIRVDGDSQLVMNKLAGNLKTNGETVELTLEKGAVFSKIVKKLGKDDSFTVKTKAAVAGVRGTQFGVEDTGGKTVVSCLEGKVAVANTGGKEIIIEEKQEVDVEAGKDIVAKQISTDRLNRMKILSDIKAVQEDIRKNYEQQRDEIRKKFEDDKAVIKKAVDDQKTVDQKNLEDQRAVDKKNIEEIKGTTEEAKKSVTEAKDKMNEASSVDKTSSTDAAKAEMNKLKPKIEKMKIEKPTVTPQ